MACCCCWQCSRGQLRWLVMERGVLAAAGRGACPLALLNRRPGRPFWRSTKSCVKLGGWKCEEEVVFCSICIPFFFSLFSQELKARGEKWQALHCDAMQQTSQWKRSSKQVKKRDSNKRAKGQKLRLPGLVTAWTFLVIRYV